MGVAMLEFLGSHWRAALILGIVGILGSAIGIERVQILELRAKLANAEKNFGVEQADVAQLEEELKAQNDALLKAQADAVQAQKRSAAAVSALARSGSLENRTKLTVDAVPVSKDECGDALTIGQAFLRSKPR